MAFQNGLDMTLARNKYFISFVRDPNMVSALEKRLTLCHSVSAALLE